MASIEVNSDGTREFSNSICLCSSQNSESLYFSDSISVLPFSIPHPTSEHENPLGDHSVLCSNDVSFILHLIASSQEVGLIRLIRLAAMHDDVR